MMAERDPNVETDDEIKRRQKSRNVAVAFAIVAFVVIIFFVTIIRIQMGIEASLQG